MARPTKLTGQFIEGASWPGESFSGVDGRGLRLITTDASRSTWEGADLRQAWFVNVTFLMGSLVDTQLQDATFVACRFDNAPMSGDWQGAHFINCSFVDADLSRARLEGVVFDGVFVGKKPPRWPKGQPVPPVVKKSGEWMARPTPPWLEWVAKLRTGAAPNVAQWLATRR